MKKKILLLLATIAAGFVSCSDDNDLEKGTAVEMHTPFYYVEDLTPVSLEIDNLDLGADSPISFFQNLRDDIMSLMIGDNYRKLKVKYKTLDQNGDSVLVSALLTYPKNWQYNDVYVVCHGTRLGNLMVPTYGTDMDEVFASKAAVCIFPDYIGIGDSSNLNDLYINGSVLGSTCTDALKVLIDYAKNNLRLSSDFKSYVVGYSQGGYAALATLHQIQQLSPEVQDALHITKVYCGDGPYNIRATFEAYINECKNGKSLGIPAVIPTVISGLMYSYPEETKHIKYEDLFTQKALRTGAPQAIRSNSANMMDMLVKMLGMKLDEVLNFDYIDSHPEDYQLLLELMERQNLCKGWELKYPTRFLHANPDAVVPFDNFLEAKKGLQNEFFEEEIISNEDVDRPLMQHGTGMKAFIKNVMNNEY